VKHVRRVRPGAASRGACAAQPRWCVGLLAALAASATARGASAQTACPSTPPSIVVEGPGLAEGAAAPQLLAQYIANSLPGSELGVLYVHQPSCAAVVDLVARRAPAAPTYAYALTNGEPQTTPCLVVNSPAADFVISDMSAETCALNLGTPTAAMLGANAMARRDVVGPVQVTSLVVPTASAEWSISADAAYVVFGFGGSPSPYTVRPWSDPTSLFAPGTQTSSLNVLASAIGLLPSKWAAAIPSKRDDATETILAGLLSPADAGATLALIPNDLIEALPDSVRVLAYQQTGQLCGYIPNSDAIHRDLINVRQGRYALWSPFHILMNLDVSGHVIDHTGQPNPTLSAIADFLDSMGPTPPDASSDGDGAADASSDSGVGGGFIPSFDPEGYLTTFGNAGLIPWCAMEVTRSSDLGAEMSYQAPEPCGCAFESVRGATLSVCPTCRADTDCIADRPRCRFGYCEVQ
jgi:hypothetical protein